MSERIKPFAEWAALSVETLGISVICLMALYALLYAIVQLVRREPVQQVYQNTRLLLGRGILLGLELLVAADIVHTVAVELSFATVGVLGIVVAIRTFLSVTLEVELTGRWPWQEQEPATQKP